MNIELKKALSNHVIWYTTNEEKGKQLFLENQQYDCISISNIELLDIGMLGCKFENSLFEKIDFSYGNFGHTHFVKSKLVDIDFIKADMNYLKAVESTFNKCNFFRTSLMNVNFINSFFYETNLSNVYLLNANLTESVFENVDFSESRLESIDFSQVVIKNCCFIGTKCSNIMNIDKAKIESIIIGNDKVLYNEEAKQWLENQVTK